LVPPLIEVPIIQASKPRQLRKPMDEHSNLKTVSVKLGLSEHYLVGRMLML
jgi:hypothetical protein